MSRRKLLDFLDQVELDHPVATWEINNVKVWPLIKIDLFFRHVKWEGKDNLLTSVKLKPEASGRVRLFFRAIKSLLFLSLLHFKRSRHVAVFFSDSSGHRVLYNGSYIDRYFKPISDFLKSKDPAMRFLTINDDKGQFERYPQDEQIYFIHRYLLGMKLWRKLFNRKKRSIKLDGYREFIAKLADKKYAYLNADNRYTNHITRKVDDILAISAIIGVLIKKYSPKVIVELCYYSTLRFGINHAAFLSGIETIEIQHGGMGRNHVSYSGWRSIPNSGYSVMPKTFWLWDESSKNLLAEWTDGHEFHSAILGGNPWLSYVSAHAEQGAYSFPTDRQIILYTLQYAYIPAHVVRAIKATPAQFQWWIRLHPRKLESKPIIEKILSEHGINPADVEITNATSYPLPAILTKAHLHVSGSSGSVIEAAQMGVFSLLVEEGGVAYYGDFVKSGNAKGAFTEQDILEIIQADKKITGGVDANGKSDLYKRLVAAWLCS